MDDSPAWLDDPAATFSVSSFRYSVAYGREVTARIKLERFARDHIEVARKKKTKDASPRLSAMEA